jgi:hypothetical protein
MDNILFPLSMGEGPMEAHEFPSSVDTISSFDPAYIICGLEGDNIKGAINAAVFGKLGDAGLL